MKWYVECKKVNICPVFPIKCSPLCKHHLGFACMGDDDIMDKLYYREISNQQLTNNVSKYDEIIEKG